MNEMAAFSREIIHCLTGVSFCVIENTEKALLEYWKSSLRGAAFQLSPAPGQLARLRQQEENCIYELRAALGIQYLLFSHIQSSQMLILGPVMTEQFSETKIRRQLHQLQLPQQSAAQVLSDCKKIPVLAEGMLHRLFLLLVQQLTGVDNPPVHRSFDVQLAIHQMQARKREEILQMRDVETRYEMSGILTDAVRQGNLSVALRLLGDYRPDLHNEVRNANPLRNFQNYCIVMNTQLRHALEGGNIHPYRLDRLSGEIGVEIEQLRSLDSARDLVFSMIQRYCKLVWDTNYPNLRPLIHLTVTYIKEHLTEDLTVKDTAAMLGVNANYLSALFHENTGMTFIDFIHAERAKQASALLLHTNLQIQQISTMVGYNSTSYFTKHFRRVCGKTPRAYRARGAD